MTYAITGASGQLGRLAAERLTATADPADIVLITRRPESLADFSARGIEVRRGDFDQPDTLSAAFAGVDRLLLVSADTVGHRLAGQRAAVQAAVAAGVSHVLYTSVPRPTADNPAGVVPDHAATEDALAASGLPWTALRNNLYADMQQPVIDQALVGGQLVTNAGDGATAYVSRADCAAAAVGALVHDGELDRSYDVTGPSAVTARDLADLASELGGRPVEVVQLDDETYAHGLESAGLPTAVAALLTSFGTSTRLGFLAATTDAVSVLGGRAPMSLRDVLRAGTASAQ